MDYLSPSGHEGFLPCVSVKPINYLCACNLGLRLAYVKCIFLFFLYFLIPHEDIAFVETCKRI